LLELEQQEMIMAATRFRLVGLAVLLATALGLGACGGGGGSASDPASTSAPATATAARGSAAIFLTDAPAAPGHFSAINVRLRRVELVPESGTTPVVVRDGTPVTINLMDLTHSAIPLSYREGVPVGRYCQIRLTVDSFELELASGGSALPELPAAGVLTLVPDGCFEVQADGVVHVQLDLDVGKSIDLHDGRYRLRPVFHVDVIGSGSASRLVRLDGRIVEFRGGDQFLLCDSVPVLRPDHDAAYRACAWIQVTPESGYFDNLNNGGTPRPLSELFQSDKLLQPATVAGVVRRFGHRYLDLNVPPGHFPPPGSCKLWYPERPAGQQPPPASCAELIRTAPVDTVVIDHDGRIVLDRRGLFTVAAVAIEVGEFLQVDGTIVDSVAGGSFTMDVAPGEAITNATPLGVALQPAPAGGNGTRIVSKTGTLLPETVITRDDEVSVDGIIVASTTAVGLRSALVVVDEAAASMQRLSGTVLSVGGTSATVRTARAEDNPCGDVPGDVVVRLTSSTSYLTVIVTNTSSTTVMGGTLAAGQTVDMYGRCTAATGTDPDQVVIIDDRRTP
jgi:hypothetical protein